jgi:hypothetical protein
VRRSSKGRDKVIRYVSNRVLGMNKTASARDAGYKQPNSQVSNLEKSNNFREITSQILADNSGNVILMLESIRNSLKNGELEKYPLNERIKMMTDLTNIQKNLSPDLRIKETIDDKGKVTRTMWNTASPMQAQQINDAIKPIQHKGETTDNGSVAEYILYDTEPTQNTDTSRPTPPPQT